MRGLRGFGFSWLDVKLGVRMLAKHPVITLASVFALAVGIPIGMLPMHVADAVSAPMPEDAGNRVRSIRYWDLEENRDRSAGYFEYARWRDDLTAFETLGAYRMGLENLEAGGGIVTIPGADVTASTLDILGTAPVQGRLLTAADEQEGAAPVVVVGYGLWQGRLGGAPDVIGSILRLGGVPHTIVGVMPDRFLFPSFAELWLPLTEQVADEPRQGDYALGILGRLADGTDDDEAQTQVTALGRRMAADFPETHGHLEAEVVTFGVFEMRMPKGGLLAAPYFYPFLAFCFALLWVACLNVAKLMFARTATRARELAVRTALGAGRARIVSQMFAESVLLAVGAVAIGLPLYAWSVRWAIDRYMGADPNTDPIPYWFDMSLTGRAVAWAFVLAIVSAAVVGVIPALRVTGKKVQRTIQKAQAGRSGVRFGGVTGAIVVADVAVAVTAIGFAIGISDRVRATSADQGLVGVRPEEFLATGITIPGGPLPWAPAPPPEGFEERLGALQRTLAERLEAEPTVRAVAFTSFLPRSDHPSRRFEVEGAGGTPDAGAGIVGSANYSGVDLGFFAALGQSVVQGRAFDEADLTADVAPVIVNTSFVDRVLGGRNAVGLRIRFPENADDLDAPWHEIVGVAPRLGMNAAIPGLDEGVYFPAAPGEIHPLRFAVRIDGPPETFEPRLRAIVQELDAEAILSRSISLDRWYHPGGYLIRMTTASLDILVLILIAMAGSGLYAVMSFAVSDRTREIGIRAALGATRQTIVMAIGRRPIVHIGLGALIGMPLAGWLFRTGAGFVGTTDPGAGMAFGVAFGAGVAVVALIGAASFTVPMRRALGIQPTEALRDT